MNIRRFTSPTTRQAMAMVRAEFGDHAIILRTRSVEGGVEIVAMADESVRTPAAERASPAGSRQGTSSPANRSVPRQPSPLANPSQAGRWRPPTGNGVAVGASASASASASELTMPSTRSSASAAMIAGAGRRPGRPMPSEPMSTLSFQQFVRDRLAHRELQGDSNEASFARPGQGPVQTPDAARDPSPHAGRDQGHGFGAPFGPGQARPPLASFGAVVPPSGPSHPLSPEATQTHHALMMPTEAVVTADSPPRPSRSSSASAHSDIQTDVLLAELKKMRGLMRSQLFSLARQQPETAAQALMQRLRGAGFSATLVRRLLEKIPANADQAGAEAWVRQLMAKVIRMDAPHRRILERGGIHALVGPTGVGKTTTVAKLAARFALRHGSDAVGLVTLDTYRIGAHDQLRTFGRLLGIPVSVAHDAAGLATFMSENVNRKLILIDTVGVGQRDERLPVLIDSTASAAIRKLLVLNAAAQPEALEDVVKAYRVGPRGGIVVSKIDEAVKLGGVVDCLVRHRLPLIGLADGQRVPEDWRDPDASVLIRKAFDTPTSAVFDFDFAGATDAGAANRTKGAAHA